MHIVEETDPPPNRMVDLLGSPEPIKPATSAPPDEEFERNANRKIKMYKISDSSGSLLLTEVGTTPLTQNLLYSADCFIIDQGKYYSSNTTSFTAIFWDVSQAPLGYLCGKGKMLTKTRKHQP